MNSNINIRQPQSIKTRIMQDRFEITKMQIKLDIYNTIDKQLERLNEGIIEIQDILKDI